jgi:hypothetical protein
MASSKKSRRDGTSFAVPIPSMYPRFRHEGNTMGTPQKPVSPEEFLYDQLIATNPKIERKGAANPYTSLNGNMFTLLHQSRLAIRLPEDKREEFL